MAVVGEGGGIKGGVSRVRLMRQESSVGGVGEWERRLPAAKEVVQQVQEPRHEADRSVDE